MARRRFTGEEIAKVLIDMGYQPVDRTGSHLKLRYRHPENPDDVRNVSVPVASGEFATFGDVDVVSPGDLPECEVLDLDCEGAELEILRALDYRPRLLTVEAHPHLGCPHDEVETELTRLEYDIQEKEPIAADSDIVNYVARQDAP